MCPAARGARGCRRRAASETPAPAADWQRGLNERASARREPRRRRGALRCAPACLPGVGGGPRGGGAGEREGGAGAREAGGEGGRAGGQSAAAAEPGAGGSGGERGSQPGGGAAGRECGVASRTGPAAGGQRCGPDRGLPPGRAEGASGATERSGEPRRSVVRLGAWAAATSGSRGTWQRRAACGREPEEQVGGSGQRERESEGQRERASERAFEGWVGV